VKIKFYLETMNSEDRLIIQIYGMIEQRFEMRRE